MDYDLVFFHPPSVYDFRKKPWFPGPIARTVHFTPAFYGLPIGYISMAEYVERHGYKVRIFNLAEYMLESKNFDPEEFIKKIKSKFYCIGLHFCVHSQGALEIARISKIHHEDSIIIMGGLTATAFSNELITNHSYVDYVIKGEGEIPLLNILDGKNNSVIPNLLYRDKDGRVKENDNIWITNCLDEFNFTRLDLITPNNLLTSIHTELGLKKHWMIPICRGCIFNCASCGGSKYSYSNLFNRDKPTFRSEEKIVEDFQKLSKQGISSVFLFMDMRMGGKKYWKSLVKTLSSNDLGIEYLTLELFTPGNKEFLSEITHLNKNIRVSFSISPESGNDNVRSIHGRHYKNTELIETVRFCRRNGLGIGVFFMFGMANQTMVSLDDTYNLFVKLNDINSEPGSGPGVRIQFGEMLLLDPGSSAFVNPEKQGYKLIFNTLQDYVNGMSSPAWTDWLSYETKELNKEEILRLPIHFRDKLVSFYQSRDVISNEQAEIEYNKNKIDLIIIEELEKIGKIKKIQRKEKRYRSLFNALKGYDNGELSSTWIMKKKLGLLDFL